MQDHQHPEVLLLASKGDLFSDRQLLQECWQQPRIALNTLLEGGVSSQSAGRSRQQLSQQRGKTFFLHVTMIYILNVGHS